MVDLPGFNICPICYVEQEHLQEHMSVHADVHLEMPPPPE